MKAFVTGSLALLVVATSLAAVRPAEEADLSWNPPAGRVTSWRITSTTQMNMQGETTEIVFSGVVRNTVKSVDGDKITFESTMADMKLSFGGREMDPAMMRQGQGSGDGKVTTVMGKNGLMISNSGSNGMPSNPRVERMQAFVRPAGKVKVGDSWEHEFKADKEKKLVDSKFRFTLEGREMKGGKNTWKVTFLYAELEGNQAMSAMGTYWIDVETREIVRMEATYENVRYVEMMPPVTSTTVLEEVKP